MAHKRVNRNPFNEKLIHRYLLEVFYGIHGADRAAINRLLPTSLHHSSVNLVVPEAHLPKKGYRPDLTLYFRGHRKAIPVEVKWTSAGTPGHQLKYLQQNGGVLVSTDAPGAKLPRVHCAQIEWPHFQEWFGRSSLRLLRDAFQPERVEGSEWIVVLRGESPRVNFDRMLASAGARSSFWAFKNNPTSIRSVLELAKGDQILFLFVSTIGAGDGRRNYEGNKLMLDAAGRRLTIVDWYVVTVTDPYYMALTGPRSTFFEKGKPVANDRYWPHFIGFNIRMKRTGQQSTVIRRGHLASPFATSANHGGVPVRLASVDYQELLAKLLAADGSFGRRRERT